MKGFGVALELMKLKLLRMAMFKTSFWVEVLSRSGYVIASFVFFEILYMHVHEIAGFSRWEMLTLVGTTGMFYNIFSAFFRQGSFSVFRLIRRGEIELVMTKPVKLRIFAMAYEPNPSALFGLPISLAILIRGVTHLEIPSINWAFWGVSFVSGFVTYMHLNLLLASLAFKLVHFAGLFWILEDMLELTKYPMRIFPKWLRIAFTYFVPVFVVSNYPVALLLGKISPFWVIVGLFTALIFTRLSGIAWRWGLKVYEGTGSMAPM